MNNSKLYESLSATLTQDGDSFDNIEMNKIIQQATDKELGSVLSDLWEDYEMTESYDGEIIASLKTLESKIRFKRIRLNAIRYAKYAAIFLVPLFSALTTYLFMERNVCPVETNCFSVNVAPGKSSDVVLPDGSKVSLNSQSSMVYTNDNEKHLRRVSLKGEANFQVTKNPKKPFVVSTEYFDVEVLGTTFNVKTYESDDLQEVALLHGKVKLTTLNLEKNSSIYLKPNQKAIYNKKTGELTIHDTDNSSETAWLKGVLVFHTESLMDIKKELERKYNVSIQMDCPAIESDSFTGVFDNETLVEVLDNLKFHYGFKYQINQNKVRIFPSNQLPNQSFQ